MIAMRATISKFEQGISCSYHANSNDNRRALFSLVGFVKLLSIYHAAPFASIG